MQHAWVDPANAGQLAAAGGAACARCRGPLPRTRMGRVKTGVRFCSQACRLATVRERRKAARTGLAAGMLELRRQLDQVLDALETMGFWPDYEKRRPSNG